MSKIKTDIISRRELTAEDNKSISIGVAHTVSENNTVALGEDAVANIDPDDPYQKELAKALEQTELEIWGKPLDEVKPREFKKLQKKARKRLWNKLFGKKER